MEYKFSEIEKKWQQNWKETNVYKVSNESDKPKFYVLDMFPYPSGAGLHVGHPLGYIASDIYSRFKRLKGFNVLHPMGYDAFGLPAEQYAIDHGIHPAVSTDNNIETFRKQLDNIGFCYDWSREVRTCDPKYYKWTQWIFLQLFNSFFNRQTKKAEKIQVLIAAFEKEGSKTSVSRLTTHEFTTEQWKSFDEKQKMNVLMDHRLAYCGYGEVNWCEALGTVLANDEVVNGVSERGGHPVEKKKLRQWYLRITEYADRLLEGLKAVDFSESMKEMQSNWIGKSSGAEITFQIKAPSRPSPGGKESQSTDPRYQTAQASSYKLTKELAIEKRDNPTHEESLMWEKLKNNQTGFHIRRQHIIGSFIVDFTCLDKLLTIEIDGGYHNDPIQKEYDKTRTEFLKSKGFTEIRFTNAEVKKDAEAVVLRIVEKLNSLPSVPEKKEAEQVLPSGEDLGGASLVVYTTRPDTIFGVDFMVIAPELELVNEIKSPEQTKAVDEYLAYVKSRSDRERMAEKKITGVFTGAYAINPFNGREIPIWISEYVLAGYGTGAIMAVPCGDERDHKFATHFGIPITNIIGSQYNGEEANATKDAILENSDFINDMVMKDAIDVVIKKIEEMSIGVRKVNYKMRDAAFSRQRYWGEPFPIIWKNGVAYPMEEKDLPVELPQLDDLKPGPDGEGPLSNLKEWKNYKDGIREVNTMPGYAGSSWYFLRYMDPLNEKEFCSRKASDYWGQVDIYIGGTEHAVGHLLYSRMWTKCLFDLGLIGHDEPYKKLVNQGMIQGSSRFVYRVSPEFTQAQMRDIDNSFKIVEVAPIFVSFEIFQKYQNGIFDLKKIMLDLKKTVDANRKFLDFFGDQVNFKLIPLHVDVNIVDGVELDVDAFRKWKPEYKEAILICGDGFISYPGPNMQKSIYISGVEIEKMSKSKFNTINPDDLVAKYGADTFRMYEMFLGPVEMSKPWDTKGIEGVHRFLRKFWRLFFDELKGKVWNAEKANDKEWKVLHKTIKKIEEDTERFSFNTAVSTFMIATNELTDLKCHKKEILEPLLILLAPYAPHIAEELYAELRKVLPVGEDLGGASILNASFPTWDGKYLKETSKAYPVAINGKTRTELTLSLDITQAEVEAIVLNNEVVKKWLEAKAPKKIIYVKNKMINVVI